MRPIRTTALISLIGTQYWSLLPLLWAVIPAVNLLLFLRVPLPPTVADDDRTPVKSLLGMPVFLIDRGSFPRRSAAMFAVLALASDAGGALGPGAAGQIAAASSGFLEPVARFLPDDGGSGLRVALLISAVVPLVFALCVPLVAPRSWTVHSGSELE
ncbi:MAG: hypothetical protein KH427_02820 [Actinomycetaceae bacterium]|nr:hypothetical protein [Actinomycetaceae bacterium]